MKKTDQQNNCTLQELPAVAVVSVTRNRCEPLVVMLSQLKELDYCKEKLGIFLVDSGSTDDTVERVRKEFPEVHLTVIDDNLGIAKGFNTGIEEALNAGRQYKYIWLLDSDVEIEKNTLMPLILTAEADLEIAVVGSAVYEPQQRDQLITAGLNIDWKNANVTAHIPDDNSTDGIYDVDLIPACSSLTRSELYHKFGLWDERLWLYWGDTEWCTRMRSNGYRVCCNIKSRAWHRNWSNIKADYYFPYAVHDRVRSALLFNLCYSPNRSLSGIQRFILKSYLKAAFENLTLRPNFNRTYHEGVLDFLMGNFSKKDFSSWAEDIEIDNIDKICSELPKTMPKQPRIILNNIANESQKKKIKETFNKYFENIIWEEMQICKDGKDTSASDRIREYLFHHLPQLLYRSLAFYKRKDLVISPVSLACLYNVAAARYTMLISPSMQVCVRKNSLCTAFFNVFKTILKGIKAAYFSLPRALKNCDVLKEIITANPYRFVPETSGKK